MRERKRIEAAEMNCLRNICGFRMWKNLIVSQRIDQGILRWFGHVERIRDERMAKRVYESDVRRVRRRGRPKKCWSD